MKNQVDVVRGISSFDGIAHVLNSSLNNTEINEVKNDVLNKKTKLLYVAPESLAKQENIDFLNQINISFLRMLLPFATNFYIWQLFKCSWFTSYRNF